MAKLQPFLIAGSDAGLETDKKSFLLPDKAFPTLENAYVWRDSVKKREGLKFIGRLRRVLTGQAIGTTDGKHGSFTNIPDVFAALGIVGENPEIEPGSLVITVGGADAATFTDNGDGTFTVTGKGLAAGSWVNYVTGEINLMFSPVAVGGNPITADFNYFPTLPTMGIIMRERPNINFEQTLIWDTKYCYAFDGVGYDEFLPLTATTWNGSNSQFFWGANYRGSEASTREFFVTNFNLDATGNPMRYTDGATWTDFEPSIASTQVNNQALTNNPAGLTPYIETIVVPGGAPITPGTVTITMSNVAGTPAPLDPDTIWTDPNRDDTLKGSPDTNDGTIDYTTGDINLVVDPPMAAGACTVTINYKYDTSTLYSARILIPYYGRLLAFNTLEGTNAGGRAGATQFFNRLRFSQVGDPTQISAWDASIFGRGGFIDAPTSEAIISAIFYKNIMIVYFERTTWQLRYVGDYGLPFVWERISSDLGSESQFASILFDEGVLGVGDRAIISSNAQGSKRIDLKIPDTVFKFRNDNQGLTRVHGIREFKKELVFWCYNDATETNNDSVFPNKTLVYNYRNDTWAIFRNNVTVFGRYYGLNEILWSRTDIFWHDFEVKWKDPDSQSEFPFVICGNQQGFIHFYGYHTKDERSLSITAIDRTVEPIQLEIINHNLESGDIIYIENLDFIDTTTSADVATDLNDQTYQVQLVTPTPPATYEPDIIEITKWDNVTDPANPNYVIDFPYTPASGTGTYIGQGTATLLPKMQIVTKDFNPFTMQGKQTKLGYIDFLTDKTTTGVVSVNIYSDTAIREKGNLLVGQSELPIQENPLFNDPVSSITWNRFYSTVFGKFISLEITYNDEQMNDRDVLDQPFELNALILWLKQGGSLAL